MFSALGVRYVDHVAVTTRDLMTTLADYLSLPGARLINGPGKMRRKMCCLPLLIWALLAWWSCWHH